MAWKKVLLLVEAATEEQFIKTVLNPHFESKEIILEPTIITTKKNASGKDHKGGSISYEKFTKEIKCLLASSNVGCVSMMLDLYKLDDTFPYRKTPSKKGEDLAKQIESAIKEDINDKKFIPYLSLHEFEALLFSNPKACTEVGYTETEVSKMRDILNRHSGNPEAINDHEKTAPSKRLQDVLKRYSKVSTGISLAKKIGLKTMRSKCSHFDGWLTDLEGAAKTTKASP